MAYFRGARSIYYRTKWHCLLSVAELFWWSRLRRYALKSFKTLCVFFCPLYYCIVILGLILRFSLKLNNLNDFIAYITRFYCQTFRTLKHSWSLKVFLCPGMLLCVQFQCVLIGKLKITLLITYWHWRRIFLLRRRCCHRHSYAYTYNNKGAQS